MSPTLDTIVNGSINFSPSPYMIASGPLTGTYAGCAACFDAGWPAVVFKTFAPPGFETYSTVNRYAYLPVGSGKVTTTNPNGPVFLMENTELISPRPALDCLKDVRRLKLKYPNNLIGVSVMAPFDRQLWQEMIKQARDSGADFIEDNFGCPHGVTQKRMGAIMGQDPDLLYEVLCWNFEELTKGGVIPLWAKLTPNVASIKPMVAAVLKAVKEFNAELFTGLTLINTVSGVIDIDLETESPVPANAKHGMKGGLSGPGIFPAALGMILEAAQIIHSEFPDPNNRPHISATGGINSGLAAAKLGLAGAGSFQAFTYPWTEGLSVIESLQTQLLEFMNGKGYPNLDTFVGRSAPRLVEYDRAVQLEAEEKASKARPATS